MKTYSGNGYDDVHAKRFALSLDGLKHNVKPPAKVLELGGGGLFTSMLREAGYDVTVSYGDLRYVSHSTGYDAVLCMEVIEHIHDQDRAIPTEWAGTGTAHMLSAAFDALKPGGFMLLTTPNADSLNVINKVIHRQAPMVYRPHVREYTVHELVEMTRSAGFEVFHVDTHECWDNSVHPEWRAKITKLLSEIPGGLPHRGEDIFVYARKSLGLNPRPKGRL